MSSIITGSVRGGSGSSGSSAETILTFLLTSALLLCHGAFGSLHLSPEPAAFSTPAGEHPAGHPSLEEVGRGECPEQYCTGVEYFAVLLSIFLAAVLWRPGGERIRAGAAALRTFESHRPTADFKLPRGPTLPLLQVYRL